MRELTAPNQDALKVTQLFNGAGQRTLTERRVNGAVTSSTIITPDGAGRSDFIEHRDGNGNTLVTYDYQFNTAGDLSWKIDHGVPRQH